MVDSFACTEEERLDYIRRNKKELQSKIYQDIKDAVVWGDVDGNAIKKKIILSSSFIMKSLRYIIQNYQDAIAICRWYGHL